MKLRRCQLKRGRVEIIPMIDTVLILLIFYMSFSTLTNKEKRLNARLPYEPGMGPTPPEVVLSVRGPNEIVVNNNTFNLATLRDALSALGQAVPDATVVIEAQPDTKYKTVVGAMDACAQARLTHVAFRPVE